MAGAATQPSLPSSPSELGGLGLGSVEVAGSAEKHAAADVAGPPQTPQEALTQAAEAAEERLADGLDEPQKEEVLEEQKAQEEEEEEEEEHAEAAEGRRRRRKKLEEEADAVPQWTEHTYSKANSKVRPEDNSKPRVFSANTSRPGASRRDKYRVTYVHRQKIQLEYQAAV